MPKIIKRVDGKIFDVHETWVRKRVSVRIKDEETQVESTKEIEADCLGTLAIHRTWIEEDKRYKPEYYHVTFIPVGDRIILMMNEEEAKKFAEYMWKYMRKICDTTNKKDFCNTIYHWTEGKKTKDATTLKLFIHWIMHMDCLWNGQKFIPFEKYLELRDKGLIISNKQRTRTIQIIENLLDKRYIPFTDDYDDDLQPIEEIETKEQKIEENKIPVKKKKKFKPVKKKQ